MGEKLNELISLCIELSNDDACYQVSILTFNDAISIYRVVGGSVQSSATKELSEKGANDLIDWVHAQEAMEAM